MASHLRSDCPEASTSTSTSFSPSSSCNLLKSLISLTETLPSVSDHPRLLCQRQNAAASIRKIKILAFLFQELNETGSGAPLLPSAVLCFRELSTTIEKVKLLLAKCARHSYMWQVLEHECISHQFHDLSQDMANALDILPLRLLDVSEEVREQVELVYLHLRRATPLLDTTAESLRLELLFCLKCLEQEMDLEVAKVHKIFETLHLNDREDCQREIQLLEDEINNQAGTAGITVVSTLNSLICFVRYCHRLLFGVEIDDSLRGSCSSSGAEELSTSGSDLVYSGTLLPPDEFRWPISLDLMLDPVVVATGHTYDRTSISKWLESDHCTCPKSGQKLLHVRLIPNYALRSMIRQWCNQHNIPFDKADDFTKEVAEDHISARQVALEATKQTAAYLVGKLATGSAEVQRQVAYELRLLAKCGMENRICIAEAGAIPFLVPLLSSRDHRTQENAVTALLNLSICENNKSLIVASGALDAVVDVVRAGGSMEARENAAATLFSLSVVNEYKVAIGSKPDAIPALVKLMREGSSRGKRDAATALFNLSLYTGNKAKVVATGAIPLLVELLTDETAGITDDSLAVLEVLAGEAEGVAAIRETEAMAVLVDLLRLGSARGKENAIAVLLALCRSGGDAMSKAVLLQQHPSALPSLHAIAARGSSRAKRKAASLLKLINRASINVVH